MKVQNTNRKSHSQYRDDIRTLLEAVSSVVYGKEEITILILIGIICNDHILLEDVPGTGKTMLINVIARILDLDFKRIQGNPDLLPGDLVGVTIFNQKENKFEFIPGPIFTNILLFDEINRASPKTQSALLEAMAERQVSVDNITYVLEKPFFVIATQNPVEHLGTYPLPQAQLDRFLIKTKVGYPTRDQERQIMLDAQLDTRDLKLPSFPANVIATWQQEFQNVFIHEELVEALLNIIQQTRDDNRFELGISPRSSKKFVHALKACAYIHGRDFVNSDDLYRLFIPVIAHRVFTNNVQEEEVLLRDLLDKENV